MEATRLPHLYFHPQLFLSRATGLLGGLMDASIASRYPFTSFAKKYLQAAGAETIDSRVLERARQRILAGIEKRELRPEDARTELASYALARVLLACLGKPGVSKKFASWEARVGARRLVEEEDSVFFMVAKDFLPSLAEEPAAVSLLDYLKFGSDLVHAQVDSGKVFLARDDLVVLLREAIAAKAGDLPRVSQSQLPTMVREAVEELAEALPKETFSGYAGKHLALPCVKKILSGLDEGRRYYGSMALAIACLRDGLAKEEARKVMEEYASNCRRSTHAFTAREALNTLEWVYKHPSIRFSCKTMRENGLVDDCEACPYRFKKRGG